MSNRSTVRWRTPLPARFAAWTAPQPPINWLRKHWPAQPPILEAMARPAAVGQPNAPTPQTIRPIAQAPRKSAGEFNLGLGILGAFLGALAGVGAMYGFYTWAGFRFPLLGVGIGVLTGYGAKLLYKGTGNT